MQNMVIRWLIIIFTVAGLPLISFQVTATPSGGDSEKQTLLAINEKTYSVLSIERLGGNTHFHFTNRIALKRYKIAAGSDGIFMGKYGERTILLTVKQLASRIPDYLQILDYNAFEVVGIQGSARSHYFIVVRSNEWASDTGSFQQIIAIPNP